MITGLGAVAPNGVGVEAFTRALRAGVSGVGLLEPGEDERCVSSVAARCEGFSPESAVSASEASRLPRLVPMALAAAREACERAELPIGEAMGEEAARGVGLALGTGGGGIDFTLDQAARAQAGGRPSLWSITNATHGNLAGELSIRLGLKGPSTCVSTGCASSSDALGTAMDLVASDRPGTPEAMVVVGADAHVRDEVLRSMEMLGVVSTRDWRGDPARAHTASRPFDASRDGFVLGEGAWAVVVERSSSARRREAEPLGRALGYGASCDAHHRVRPAPDMGECARAMRDAIADAGIEPADVGVIHYHGTGTRLNDALETRAVREAFGEHAERLAGSSVKSMIGHPQGACGLAAVVATLAGLTGADGGAPFIAPTINLERPDPECDLDYTPNGAMATEARTALVNCLAFGARNAALVVRAGG